MEIQTDILQPNITIEYLPYGSDMPYRIIVTNNPLNLIDPLGLLAAPCHFGTTFTAALNSGKGVADSAKLAWGATATDFADGSQGRNWEATRQHAMAGILPDGTRQTSAEAIAATGTYIQDSMNNGNLAGVIHAIQDIATPYLPQTLNPYVYVTNNPLNLIDPLGLYWFRQDWQLPGVVGRRDTPVPPRGPVSEFIEKDVPAGYTFGEMHDAFVGEATSAGLPDWLVNIPSMLPMYLAAQTVEVLRSLGILDQPEPVVKPTSCK